LKPIDEDIMSKIETLQGVGEFVGRFVSTPCTFGSRY